jgi:hypothetical protein
MKRLDDPLTAAIRGLDTDGDLDDAAVQRVRLAALGTLRRELDAIAGRRGQATLSEGVAR